MPPIRTQGESCSFSQLFQFREQRSHTFTSLLVFRDRTLRVFRLPAFSIKLSLFMVEPYQLVPDLYRSVSLP
jgi:hypothetical protein